MRTLLLSCLLGVAALSLAVVRPAHADVGVPIEVQLIVPDPNLVPVPGDVVRATLELTSEIEVVVTGVDIESGRNPQGNLHWEPVLINTPTDIQLMPGVARSFDVELLANDPTEPVDVVFMAGARTIQRRFFVVAPADRATSSLPAAVPIIGVPTQVESPAADGDPAISLWQAPQPYELAPGKVASDKQSSAELDQDLGAHAKAGLINVKGRLVYSRSDGLTVGVDGATVMVYDSNVGSDLFLGKGVTLADGNFDFNVLPGPESAPELYVVFLAANSVVNVQYSWALSSVSSFVNTWSSDTTVYGDFTGSVLDLGTRKPSGAATPAFHIASTITKAWRYVGGLGFKDQLTRVRVSYPAGTAIPYYLPSSKTIFMNIDRQWREDSMIHEFGHHWLHAFGVSPSTTYCNPGGFADPPFQNCGHNQWCEENTTVAWVEGFPNFLADMTINWIQDNYHATLFERDVETIQACDENSQYGDPYKTESILSAMLRDLADSDNEDDPAFGNNGYDLVAQGVASVLGVASGPIKPFDVASFLASYRIAYPALANNYWFTAMNNGYDLDTAPPDMPGGFTSTSHSTVGESSDGTVDLVWTRPLDDLSGVRRYILEAANFPVYPAGAGSWVVSTHTGTTTPDLAPGTWYISILAEDWSGKQSVNYAVFGPVTIRDPEPADFAVATGRSWPYPVVPRKTEDTTESYAPLPTWLAGDQAETWFNYRVENSGELPNPLTVYNRLWVDGVLQFTNSIPITVPLGGGTSRIFYNQGPYTIRGGRHRVVVQTDATELMPEADEFDNRYARQFVWAPTVLVSTPADRAAPPDPYGGFTSTNPLLSVNCDGLAFPGTTAPFTGLAIVPDLPGDDPDIRSFLHTTGPEDGFDLFGTLAGSSRRAGAVDAVITNTSSNPGLVVDAGIYRIGEMNDGYRAFPLASTNLPTSTESQVTLAAGEYISLHDFLIPGNFGSQYGTIRVSVPPEDGPLWVALIPPDDAHFGLDDATVVGQTMRTGVVTLNFTYTSPQHCLVLYRDRPSDGSEPRAVTATVWVGPTPANFLAAEGLAGWAAPVVPTDGAAGTPSNVPAPPTLSGGTQTTYLNTAIANDGPNPAVPLEHFTMIDGTNGPGEQSSGIVAGGTHTKNFTAPITVPGGRHSLWMNIDPNDLVGESDEADNIWGQQWVWQPQAMSPGPATDFSAPGDPIGGLDAVVLAQNSTFYLNCVGLRDPAPLPSGNDGHWRGVVVMPGAASDVDTRLHDVDFGVTNGFRNVLTSSNWGVGQSDYVLTNFRVVSAKPMDVGVVSVQGNEDFMAQAVESTFLATKPDGVYGDFSLGDRELLALHEVELEAGLMKIDLIALSGAIDWGMTLHRANLPYQSKALSNANPSAWTEAAGVGESLVVNVPQDGYYCLAVWKAGHADAGLVGSYRLGFTANPTAAPPVDRIARTGLRSIQPNPFNPRTVISFELLRSGPVDLRVFDLRGGLVRTLVHEVGPAGRHEVAWNGLDDRGRQVASGVYFVSLRAEDVQDVRKAVLVK